MKKINKILKWSLDDSIKVIVGSFLYCFAINYFIVPNNLYTGGVLGIAQLIRSFIIEIFNLETNFDFSGIIYYLINIPLFVMAYKSISKTFFYRTIVAVTSQTILLSILPNKLLVENILTNVVVGKIGLLLNVIIYTIAGFKYGIETMIYSIINAVVDSRMVDKLHEQNICSTALIFSKENPKVINDYIKNELNRDFTYWDAKGGFDDSRTYIIYTALTKYELIKLERTMKELNIRTFMVKSEGIGIKGEFEKDF